MNSSSIPPVNSSSCNDPIESVSLMPNWRNLVARVCGFFGRREVSLFRGEVKRHKALIKPRGYTISGGGYKVSLMKDFLHERVQCFDDDDWLYLIIKMGKRAINEKKIERFMEEFTSEEQGVLFKKIAVLQCLRYQIEDMVYCSHFKRREKIYQASKEDGSLFLAEKLHGVINMVQANQCSVLCAKTEDLYATASINHECHNPFFSDLVIACYKHSGFLPPDLEVGHRIEHELKENILKESVSLNDVQIESMLEDDAVQKSVCGGRSIQLVLPDGEVLYLKFQRKQESWEDFTRELKMHKVLQDQFSGNHFASEIPVCKFIFSLPEAKFSWACESRSSSVNRVKKTLFDDELEVSKGYIYGYCFSASKDYVNYASQPDFLDAENPHAKSEQGLKKAAADLGKYARYGLTFDSIIKIQHLKTYTWEGLTKWMSLSQLSSYFCKNLECFPGAMCDWVEDVEYSDLSWSGLRDLGDSQIFEDTSKKLNPDNVLNKQLFPKVGNLLAYFNAIMDNFVAIVMVYSRCKRLSPEFHYQNPVAVDNVKKFLSSILRCFLQGYYSKHEIVQHEMFALNGREFDEWLNRTALEILYWSAIQPDEMTDEFYNSSHDHKNQNYSVHIDRDQHPDPEIMETSVRSINTYLFYHNGKSGNRGFGFAHDNSFPLQALMKGLCLLFRIMLEQQHD